MAQLFPHSANSIVRAVLISAPLVVGAAAWATFTAYWSSYNTDVGVPRHQTIPFSHKHHVGGLGIDCRYCHTGVETSAFAGIPPTETCMTCHSQVWRDAPALQPVRDSWTSGTPLRWTRVHKLPDYVFFNHSAHVRNGVACESCHGRVDEMPLMAKAENLTMRWCLECHHAPVSHLRPPEEVFEMNDSHEASSRPPLESALFSKPQIARLEDCSICHR